jgi:hypothetical protein
MELPPLHSEAPVSDATPFDPNTFDAKHLTPLIVAVKGGKVEEVNRLLGMDKSQARSRAVFPTDVGVRQVY